MKIETKLVEKTESGHRFEVFVNHKRQGIIIGILEAVEERKSPDYKAWAVEGDAFKNEYPSSNKAIEAVCAKNGRKVSIEDNNNKKKKKK